jgi:AraC-like DNA-binding protein
MTAPSFSDVHDTDAEQAEVHLSPSVHLDRRPTARFAFHRHTVARGALDVEEDRCTDGVRIEVIGQSTYALGLPVRGTVHADHRGDELDLGPGRAAVFDPDSEAAVTTGEGFDVVLVRIRSAALEDALEALLGRSVRRPLRPRAVVDLDSASGRALMAAIRRVADARPGTTSTLSYAISADPLEERLLLGLLLTADHPDREALDEPVPTWAPRTVRRCVDLIEAHPELPLTPATLAAAAGLSVRALEGCWVRHRERPPGHDVARVRLDRAHRDLDSHRPGETTVGAVAASWGFRPQPFVSAYRTRFGRPPEHTLRGPGYA